MEIVVKVKLQVDPAIPMKEDALRFLLPSLDSKKPPAEVVLSNTGLVEMNFRTSISEDLANATEGRGRDPDSATSWGKVRQEAYSLTAYAYSLASTLGEIARWILSAEGGDSEIAGGIKIDNPDRKEEPFRWEEVGGDRRGFLPMEGQIVFGGASGPFQLDATTYEVFRRALENGYRPLFAWHHYGRASADFDPRGIYVDATAAAELGIKQFLIERYPALQEFLERSPSPNLAVLYGSTLERVTGQPSISLASIRTGVEARNRVMHRPTRDELDHQEAADYVKAVREALLQLEWFRLLQYGRVPPAGQKSLARVMPPELIEFWVNRGYAHRAREKTLGAQGVPPTVGPPE